MGIKEILEKFYHDTRDPIWYHEALEIAEAELSALIPSEEQVKEMMKNLIYEMWAEPKPDSVCDRCELEGREWQPAYATETIDRTTKAICSLPVKKEIDNG